METKDDVKRMKKRYNTTLDEHDIAEALVKGELGKRNKRLNRMG